MNVLSNKQFPKDFDVDDVGALCAAHGLVQLGEAEILAVGESKKILFFKAMIKVSPWYTSVFLHTLNVVFNHFLARPVDFVMYIVLIIIIFRIVFFVVSIVSVIMSVMALVIRHVAMLVNILVAVVTFPPFPLMLIAMVSVPIPMLIIVTVAIPMLIMVTIAMFVVIIASSPLMVIVGVPMVIAIIVIIMSIARKI